MNKSEFIFQFFFKQCQITHQHIRKHVADKFKGNSFKVSHPPETNMVDK